MPPAGPMGPLNPPRSDRKRSRFPLATTYRHARRIAIFIVGCTMLITGIAMLVLPGPAILVIPAGLGVLSLEFAWARRWLHHLRDRFTTRPTPAPEVERPAPRQNDLSDFRDLEV